jgi:hypothetical protein
MELAGFRQVLAQFECDLDFSKSQTLHDIADGNVT